MSTLPVVDGSQLTGIVFVNQDNQEEIIYVKGNEGEQDSLRIIPGVSAGSFRFEFMTDGVWNLSPIEVAPSTIHLGQDLSLSSAGEWLKTFSENINEGALIPHVNFDATGTGIAHSPALGPLQTNIIQPDFSSEVIGKDLQNITINPIELFASAVHYKVGSVGATKPITVIYRHGVDTDAPIFWERDFPIDFMRTPDSDIIVDILGQISGETGEPIHTQFISDELISLKSDSSGQFYTVGEFQPWIVEDIVLDNQVITNELDFVFQNDGGFIINDPFPG